MIRQHEDFVSWDDDQAALCFVPNMINPYVIFVLTEVSLSYTLNMVQIYNDPQTFLRKFLEEIDMDTLPIRAL